LSEKRKWVEFNANTAGLGRQEELGPIGKGQARKAIEKKKGDLNTLGKEK